MKRKKIYIFLLVVVIILAGVIWFKFLNRGPKTGNDFAFSDATAVTVAANAALAKSLNLADQKDFEDAKRGLIAVPTGKVLAKDGSVVWDFDRFRFVEGDAPSTVNPSLWRHAKLNKAIGLFKVVDGVYQLRGFDNANLTLIEGKTGWIVHDPLSCRETTEAAMAFARKHLGNKPVSVIIFNHSHIDHFRRGPRRHFGGRSNSPQDSDRGARRIHGGSDERKCAGGNGHGAARHVAIRDAIAGVGKRARR